MTKRLKEYVDTMQSFVSWTEERYGITGVINDFYKSFCYARRNPYMTIALGIVFQRKTEAENEKYSDTYNDLCGVLYEWAVENLKGNALKRFMKEVEHEE